MPRELILLSPYTPPTQHALSLAAEDTAGWLNAWTALWHPAVLGWLRPARRNGPRRTTTTRRSKATSTSFPKARRRTWPAIGSERAPQSRGDRVPGDRRPGRHAGSAPASSRRDRTAPRFNGRPRKSGRSSVSASAYVTVETLFEAMEHERLLDQEEFWADVQAAVRDPKSAIPHLQNAAAKLQAARDSLVSGHDSPARFCPARRPICRSPPGTPVAAQPHRHRRGPGDRWPASNPVDSPSCGNARAETGDEPLVGNLRRHLLRPRGRTAAGRIAVVEPAPRAGGRRSA